MTSDSLDFQQTVARSGGGGREPAFSVKAKTEPWPLARGGVYPGYSQAPGSDGSGRGGWHPAAGGPRCPRTGCAQGADWPGAG